MDHEGPRRLTLRAGALSVLLVVGIAVAGSFSALYRYDLIGLGHLPRCALFPMLLFVVLNVLWRRCRGRPLLGTQQMLYIYVAILVMAGLPGQQMVTYLYLGMIGPVYYATPENRYESLYFRYLPDWLVPSKDKTSDIILYAFEGVPTGGDIPWRAWLVPVLAWMPYVLGLLFVMLCLAAILRRRWSEEEKLLFPLATIPVEVVTPERPDVALPQVFRNKLAWLFFMVPVVLYSLNALHMYWPGVPEVDLRPDGGIMFGGRPWSLLNYFPFYLYFDMMGITFLITSEVGFALWFFWLARRLSMVARDALGATEHGTWFSNMGAGAYVLLTVAYLWMARGHLYAVFRKAVLNDPRIDDSDEPMSYRLAFWGLIGGLVVVIAWCNAIGMAVGWALILIAIYLSAMLILTRLVAEAGLFCVWLPHSPPQRFMVRMFGHHNFHARSLTALGMAGFKIQDSASLTAANILEGYKIGELVRLRPRTVLWLMAAVLLVSVFACHAPSIYSIYDASVPALGWWPRGAGQSAARNVGDLVGGIPQATWWDYSAMMYGGLFVVLLNLLRQRFVWWPFHPLGYVAMMGPQFMGDRYGFSIFVGWFLKWAVVRVGGTKAYRAARPSAIGLVVGNAFVLFVWLIIQSIWPVSGVLAIE
ncbi:MAG: DUF6785 family protein [Armatimonadota bacterium]